MPNGDLLANDYEFQLGETLYGRGNGGVQLDIKPVEGLGVPDAKTQDVLWFGADGAYANPDYLSVRQLTIPCIMKATTETTVMTNLKALTLDWVPQTADIDLAFQFPAFKFYVMGRPRGLKADLEHERRGVVRVLLRFDCPDPTMNFL